MCSILSMRLDDWHIITRLEWDRRKMSRNVELKVFNYRYDQEIVLVHCCIEYKNSFRFDDDGMASKPATKKMKVKFPITEAASWYIVYVCIHISAGSSNGFEWMIRDFIYVYACTCIENYVKLLAKFTTLRIHPDNYAHYYVKKQ